MASRGDVLHTYAGGDQRGSVRLTLITQWVELAGDNGGRRQV